MMPNQTDDAETTVEGRAIALIGGSGFIGTRFCRRVAGRHDVRIIDRAPSWDFPERLTIADVRDAAALEAAIPIGATIVNLAAEHRDDVRPLSLYDAVNVGGARNCCAAARARNVTTIVFFSTVAVYGFAAPGTGEDGRIAPFNAYGRSKYEAEEVYRAWQAEAPADRGLVIVRPTVVFGERNRGNVYNLFRQIASGKFIMVGGGQNRKSMAYVENIAAFLEQKLVSSPGVHVFNYIDKPDFDMNTLVSLIRRALGRDDRIGPRIPSRLALLIGRIFDLYAFASGRKLAISAIRVKKFTTNSIYDTAISAEMFVPPVPLERAIEQTIRYEFLEDHSETPTFETE